MLKSNKTQKQNQVTQSNLNTVQILDLPDRELKILLICYYGKMENTQRQMSNINKFLKILPKNQNANKKLKKL